MWHWDLNIPHSSWGLQELCSYSWIPTKIPIQTHPKISSHFGVNPEPLQCCPQLSPGDGFWTKGKERGWMRVTSQKRLCALQVGSEGFMGCLGRCEGTAAHPEFPPESLPCSLGLERAQPGQAGATGKTTTGTGLGMCSHKETLGWHQGSGGARNGNHPEPSWEQGLLRAGQRCQLLSQLPWKNDGFGGSGGQSCCSGSEIPLGSAHRQPGGASRCHPSLWLQEPLQDSRDNHSISCIFNERGLLADFKALHKQ